MSVGVLVGVDFLRVNGGGGIKRFEYVGRNGGIMYVCGCGNFGK